MKPRLGTALIVIATAALAGCGSFEDPELEPDKGFEIKRISGTVKVDPVGATSVEIEDTTRAPDGAEVDATRGIVQVRSAVPGGGEQSARLRGGVFKVRSRAEGAITELELTGTECNAGRRGTPFETRRLLGEGRGRFTTRGEFAAAIVRGTSWGVRDRCDGTIIIAREGTVVAEELRTGRRVTLRVNPGEPQKTFLARGG